MGGFFLFGHGLQDGIEKILTAGVDMLACGASAFAHDWPAAAAKVAATAFAPPAVGQQIDQISRSRVAFARHEIAKSVA